jgi:hypothetical protein
MAEALRRISAELAGLEKPPADPSTRPPAERLLRLHRWGDVFESDLAAHVGPARAHELRLRGAGFGGQRRQQQPCPAR